MPRYKSQQSTAPFLWDLSSRMDFLRSGLKVHIALLPKPAIPGVGFGLSEAAGLISTQRVSWLGAETAIKTEVMSLQQPGRRVRGRYTLYPPPDIS